MNKIIPIIDLFAGPGGLGEGFSKYSPTSPSRFKIALSIEKDENAHETLLLRSFYRQFPFKDVPNEYFSYLRGEITKEKLYQLYPVQFKEAQEEALQLTLSKSNRKSVSDLIKKKISGHKIWILIGGPPCQAYSIVGRSRMLGTGKGAEQRLKTFEKDHRHTLYKEYLHTIAEFHPPIFVMENVRGILSAKFKGEPIFPKIISDLSNPSSAIRLQNEKYYSYSIFSFVTSPDLTGQYGSKDYVIKAEEHGIPQTRHRVILLGIRNDLLPVTINHLNKSEKPISVQQMISDLPLIRSGLSKDKDSIENWKQTLSDILESKWFIKLSDKSLKKCISMFIQKIKNVQIIENRGKAFIKTTDRTPARKEWFKNSRLSGVTNHMSRGHIKEDLHRYLYAACYAQTYNRSPKLHDFPSELLPKHKNIGKKPEDSIFGDRFRVQVAGKPATTITSHISKDGHYFIHPNPLLCRSLTVREAARLQTFPDDYHFEGPRTAQYIQVGNAVPPLLAYQLADVVWNILKDKSLI